MRMCFNKRVLVGLGVVVLAVLAVAPRFLGSIAPLLLLAACPLSMVFMMRSMNRPGHDKQAGDAPVTGATGPVLAPAKRDHDADVRELQEEVNRLKAEIHIRDQAPSA